jgi:hypothetical protein
MPSKTIDPSAEALEAEQRQLLRGKQSKGVYGRGRHRRFGASGTLNETPTSLLRTLQAGAILSDYAQRSMAA